MRKWSIIGRVRSYVLVLSKLAVIGGLNVVLPASGQEPAQVAHVKLKAAAASTASSIALSKADAARLALYTANNEPLVVLAIAAHQKQNGEVAAAVKRHGGRVDFRLDTVDYLVAVLPTLAVPSFLAEPALQAVALDNLEDDHGFQVEWLSMNSGWREPDASSPDAVGSAVTKIGGVALISAGRAPSLPARPLERPYSILRDMDGEAFRQRDSRFDGRGVVIAHIEDFPDFLSPELQIAKDASGREIPKFADVINIPAPAVSLNPDAPRRGDRWTTRLSKPIRSDRLTLRYGNKTFQLPEAGTYRLAQFELPSTGWGKHVYLSAREAHVAGKVLKKGAPLLLDVLWSERDKRLWIDSNGNGDFGDEKGVGEYRTSHQFGVLGKDDPTTKIRESAPYAVQADGNYVSVNLAYSSHVTKVAGAAAASRGNGLIDGVAPGAQLIAINGLSMGSVVVYARALATAYMNPQVDVVLVEAHRWISMPYSLKDGQSLLAILQSRLVEYYKKPTLVTASNPPFMSKIEDLTAPQNVISVGASQSAASLFSYYGIKSRIAQDLHWSGAEGPSGDGALKPDILAPANPLSPSNRDRWERGALYPGVFLLPVGYYICGGTSCAAPVAAGAAALLVGAAKLRGLPHDAEAIHEALRNTASFLDHVPAYKQGRGIVQVDAAWRYLVARTKVKERYDIDIAAPVRTVWSDTLLRPHTGRGLFEREGWRAGMRQERVILLTRRSGPKGPVRFAITWQGNGGTFTSSDSISLPLNKAVSLRVGVTVEAPGAYSAIAHLSRSSMPGPAASIPVTIVVPHEFTSEQHFSWSDKVMLERPAGRRNLFFRVPEGVKAFSVSVSTPRKGISLILVPPHNPDEIMQRAETGGVDGSAQYTIEMPASGVWEAVLHDMQDVLEFDWLAADQDYLPPTAVEVSARILGTSAVVERQDVRVENKLASFSGGITNVGLGGVRAVSARLLPWRSLVHDIEVEPGQELLVVEIGRLGGASLDADLHLFDCTRGTCAISRRSNKRGPHERVVVEGPAPGRWKAVVLTSGAEQGAMKLEYTDYYTHPKLGTLSTTDAPQQRKSGETWQSRFNVWRAGEPRQGYKPTGVIRIKDPSLWLRQLEAYAFPFSPPVVSRAAYLELKPFPLGSEPASAVAALSHYADSEHRQSGYPPPRAEQAQPPSP